MFFEAGFKFLNDMNRFTIENFEITNMTQNGIQIGLDSNLSYIENNIIHHNGEHGIFYEGSDHDITTAKINNNTIAANSKHGIYLDGTVTTGSCTDCRPHEDSSTFNGQIINNFICQCAAS